MALQHVTLIKVTTPDAEYTNVVYHNCSLGEFLKDIRREIDRYRMEVDGEALKIDLFWHLDEYCTRKHGDTHWQIINIKSLLKGDKG